MNRRTKKISVRLPIRLYNILDELKYLYIDESHPQGNLTEILVQILREWSESPKYDEKQKTLLRMTEQGIRRMIFRQRLLEHKRKRRETN